MRRLMLCAGVHRREGWLTLDGNPANAPNILAMIPPLPQAVKSQRWEEIEWIHGVGSLYPWEAEDVLRELRCVLEPGGKLVLEQPNAQIAVQSMRWLFGDPSHRDPLIMNRWCYSPDELQALLESLGYRDVKLLPAQHHNPHRDFRMEAMA